MTLSKRRKVLVCSCERSMPGSYGEDVARGCHNVQVESGDQFCGVELDRVRTILNGADAVTIGCVQQAPLFRELAEELAYEGELSFANIRETAGWAERASAAGPKAAALLAMAAEPSVAPAQVTLSSNGVILIYGRDETAIEAGRQLADKLDVTVLLARRSEITPPRVWDFPVMQGTVRNARGHLGAFEMVIDDFAAPVPSSRDRLCFGTPRDGAISQSDIVLDLSGETPLFPAHELRDGYVKADPSDLISVAGAIGKMADFVGEFDKPRFIDFSEDLCAHSRSQIIGCRRCLDLCPTGAIAPAGDHVAVDANICAGCGNCAAVCPTGAAAYALPDSATLLRRLRTLLLTYREAGGNEAIVLFHDLDHGVPLIDALARFGTGLPANVLPVAVNAVMQLGIEAWAAPVAWGAIAVRALSSAKPRHDIAGVVANIKIANLLTDSLGYGSDVCGLVETDDPDVLKSRLDLINPTLTSREPATFLPVGKKRSVLDSTMIELHRVAPTPVDFVMLPAGAPFGSLEVNIDGCTLCLSCVAACPTGALSDNEQRPALYFAESACVQCGLCAATCPEQVVTLVPQLDFRAWNTPRRVVKEEEPYLCIHCGKPFGTKSTIERIVAKLEGKHWMFAGENARRLDVVRMCENCRIDAVMNQGFDPYAGPARAAPRTTEDYLCKRTKPGKPV
ncbi:4Fe-4S dicluster domain-containing protein [Pseudaminobacter arsenicus]|uniref:4Fe-4S dicluster domain-containing protein n=1 Tax=Borborobacter arsenicus TaxID=1851146 RepID=A0A432V0V7_9HYPH|nr:4Fe-4S binding protein [Pseudaminobacter arsenicus]RUM95844.1 4Fe-4S dicluster domain-containing protein [Pseudaminobacter arsenicus]